jgi:hypothetical protein
VLNHDSLGRIRPGLGAHKVTSTIDAPSALSHNFGSLQWRPGMNSDDTSTYFCALCNQFVVIILDPFFNFLCHIFCCSSPGEKLGAEAARDRESGTDRA